MVKLTIFAPAKPSQNGLNLDLLELRHFRAEVIHPQFLFPEKK
jgi:hypothetical protein